MALSSNETLRSFGARQLTGKRQQRHAFKTAVAFAVKRISAQRRGM
jgi:hypothetical protein